MEILEGVENRITPKMNSKLGRVFTADEVVLAPRQMHSNKAPGPDGMSPILFQKYWYIVGGNVIAAVLDVLNTVVFPDGLNHTLLVLIPKKKSPMFLTLGQLACVMLFTS